MEDRIYGYLARLPARDAITAVAIAAIGCTLQALFTGEPAIGFVGAALTGLAGLSWAAV